MSERLEQWKAREKLRSGIGWAAVYFGIWGALAIPFAIVSLSRSEFGRGVAELAFGGALLFFARALWNAQIWARWGLALFFAAVVIDNVAAIVQGRSLQITLPFGVLPFALFGLVYLLLPSTGASFARAARRTGS